MDSESSQSTRRQQIKEKILMYDREKLVSLIKSDIKGFRGWKRSWGFPGFWIVLGYRISHNLQQKGVSWPAKFVQVLITIFTGCNISRKAIIGPRLCIYHPRDIFVGPYVCIGKNCDLGPHVFIGANLDHSSLDDYPIIDEGFIIAVGAVILGGVTVGEKVRVAPNAVVLKDIPDKHNVMPLPSRTFPRDAWKNQQS